MKRFLILMAMGAMLASCGNGVSSESVGDNDFNPSNLSYFKDYRTNLCYSVQSYSRYSTGGTYAYGQSHTEVPCNDEVMKLVRNKS